MKTRAVIFDRDNTLLRLNQRAIADFGAQMSELAPCLSLTSVMQCWLSWPGPWPRTTADEADFWRRFWTSAALPAPLHADQLAGLCELGAGYATCFEVFPDAPDCLAALKAAGMRLALLTNFELPSIEGTLRHAGIDPALFDVALSSSTLEVSKPDPRAFYAITTALDESPDACAFIDDLAEHVVAARSLGMRAFQIDRTRSIHDQPNNLLCSLEPLPRMLLSPFTVE